MLSAAEFKQGIDEHAKEYQELQAKVAAATLKLKGKKKELVKLAKKRGSVPEGAEKTLRLEGDRLTIDVTFGTSSSVDEVVVDQIKEQLSDDCQARLFSGLFQEQTSHIVSPTAPTVLENCSKMVRKLFDSVLSTKPKEPSLKVKKNKAAAKAKAAA